MGCGPVNKINKLGMGFIFLISIAFIRCSTIDVQRNKGCIWGDCVNGFGIERYIDPYGSNDYFYIGEWKNKKKNGKGTNTDIDGSKYMGQWKDNLRHGEGILSIKDGVFTGRWEGGDMKGVFTYESKTVKYTGTFLRRWEYPHYFPSYGEIHWADGSGYKGDFGPGNSEKNSCGYGFPNGHGEYTSPEGKVYHGDFSCTAFSPYPIGKAIYYGSIQTSDGNYEFFLDVVEGKSPIQFKFLEVKKP